MSKCLAPPPTSSVGTNTPRFSSQVPGRATYNPGCRILFGSHLEKGEGQKRLLPALSTGRYWRSPPPPAQGFHTTTPPGSPGLLFIRGWGRCLRCLEGLIGPSEAYSPGGWHSVQGRHPGKP